MYDRLRELGVPVKLTRTGDETLSPTERVNRILDAYGNNSNVIVVSNHINAGGEERNEHDQILNHIFKPIERLYENNEY